MKTLMLTVLVLLFLLLTPLVFGERPQEHFCRYEVRASWLDYGDAVEGRQVDAPVLRQHAFTTDSKVAALTLAAAWGREGLWLGDDFIPPAVVVRVRIEKLCS